MRPSRRAQAVAGDQAAWSARSARLFGELRGPATGMVRRAYGRAFDEHAIEDVYAAAWLGTYRALAGRHHDLADDEIRSYVLTAVARQASKELRRRRRRPVAPLESAGGISDGGALPDERADQHEQATITRDLLASLPRRRRAVLMLRYGWGLEPRQVCELIEGLSPRAYRKEITRGVDELAERIRRLERGEWCADREPILKAFAAGLADDDQARQAERHLAHCRHCSDFVARLTGHLHDAGAGVALGGTFDLAADGTLGIAGRAAEAFEWLRGLVPTGGTRGAAPGAAGALAKLGGLGAAGNASIACFGAAAILCVAGGATSSPSSAVARDPGGDRTPQARPAVLVPPQAPQSSPAVSRARADSPVRRSADPPRSTTVTGAPPAPSHPVINATHTRRSYETRWFGARSDADRAAPPAGEASGGSPEMTIGAAEPGDDSQPDFSAEAADPAAGGD